MNLYLDKFAEGAKEAVEEYLQSPSIFDIKGGNLFPNHTSQQMWQFARGPEHLNFSDGNATYSFKGKLHPTEQTYVEKVPDVPLPDMFSNHTAKGKAQVHRSSPGSIYFTLQEGKENPTYTLRHASGNRWSVIPKPRKAKKQLQHEPYVPNLNVEHVKQGMEAELQEFLKEADGGLLDFFNHALGQGAQGLANLPARLALLPARLGGLVTHIGDQDPYASEDLSKTLGESALMGLAGAGLGAGYHVAKRNLYNTPEENAAEDPEALYKRMFVPAVGLGLGSLAGRTMAPAAVNNPSWNMFGK